LFKYAKNVSNASNGCVTDELIWVKKLKYQVPKQLFVAF
jgi:hypothetical protein